MDSLDAGAVFAAAQVVSDQARDLQAQGRRTACLPVTERAVELFRAVVALDSSTRYRSGLAAELMNLALRQDAAGQSDRAVAAAEESVSLRRRLVEDDRYVYRLELVRSLLILAGRLKGVGRAEVGAQAAREAIELCREVVGPDSPESEWYHLSTSVATLSGCLREAGLDEQAVSPTREAVDLARTLVTLNRSARNLDDLTASLATWIGHRRLCGRPVAPDEFQECVRLGREVPATGGRRAREPLLSALGLQLANSVELQRWDDVRRLRAEIATVRNGG